MKKTAQPKKAKKTSPRADQEKKKLELLGRSELFSRLDAEELAIIGRYSGFHSFSKGAVVFSEGGHVEELYVVHDGEVIIRKHTEDGGEQDIARFLPGEAFAEMDLLDTSPRTASAVAEAGATLLVFPRHGVRFTDILDHHPEVSARILSKILAVIAGRIRATDRLLSEKTPWIQEMKRQLQRDKLTSLYNRAYLEEELPALIKANPRVELLVLKPDNFKAVNDSYGHEAGDKALVMLAHAIRVHLKDDDVGVRYRGDEFCAVLPGRGAEECMRTAELLKGAVKAIDFSAATGGPPLSLTASIGLAACHGPELEARAVIARGFERMLEARGAGGNRIVGGECP